MTMRIVRFIPIILFAALGCVERIDLPSQVNRKRIVVDGLITNKPGPHSVNLFLSTTTDGLADPMTPVTGATVAVVDDFGNTFALSETMPGTYETASGFSASVGRAYKLVFTTRDNRSYESTMQVMHPAGTVKNVTAELVLNAINPEEPLEPQHVYRFYFDSEGEPGSPNLFRWRWRTTFEMRAYPEYNFYWDYSENNQVRIPDPLPCSGFVVDTLGGLKPIGECVCCSCWIEEYSKSAQVSNNRIISQPEFRKVQIAQIPIDRARFQVRYYMRVEQLSVSPEVYAFWKQLQTQQESTGDIFQPNTIHIQGNMRSLSDPNEEVSGIFSVSAVATNDIFIDRQELPFHLPIDTVFQDCRRAYPGSTNVRPSFW
jgi:hypothetical protein